MTSKISYFKLIGEDIRHRSWFAALAGVGLFLLMPVYTLLWLDSFLNSFPGYTSRSEMIQEFLQAVPGLISGERNSLLPAVFAVLAVMAALSGFSWLHSREKLDFFHSLPVKRLQWFAITCISGLVMFLVPYVLCSALVVAVVASRGAMSISLVLHCAAAVGNGVLAYLLIFLASTLAVMLTGRTVTALLAAIVITVYPFLALSLFTSLQSVFFDSFYLSSGSITNQLASWLSPVVLFESLTSSAGSATPSVFLAAAVMSAVLLAAAAILYRFYPSEAAGNALSFPAAAPIFKILVCIPASLFLSLMVQTFIGTSGAQWTIGLSLLIVVILCALTEFIYHQDLKLLWKGWRSSLISIAGTALILVFLQFDLAGYDTWLPEGDRLESIAFRPDTFLSYFQYQTDYRDESPAEQVIYTENTEILRDLASSGIDNLEKGITPRVFNEASVDSEITQNYVNTAFFYRMKSGRIVRRQYCVSASAAEDALVRLCEDESYRRSLFPVFGINRETVHSLGLSDAYGIEEVLKLTEEQRNDLLDAYEKDILNADVRQMNSVSPLGELFIHLPDPALISTYDPKIAADSAQPGSSSSPETITLNGFYIYPGYENTLSCLEKYGYTLRTEIIPEDVERIELHISTDSLQSARYSDILSQLSDSAEYYMYDDVEEQITVTSKEDIKILLEHLHPWYSCPVRRDESMADYANIEFTNDSGYYGFRLE